MVGPLVPDEVVYRFPDEGVTATGRCSTVWSPLPVEGLLPDMLRPPCENETPLVGPGDVAFLTVEEGSGYGIEELEGAKPVEVTRG